MCSGHEVVVKVIGRLFRIVHHVSCILGRLGVILVHIKGHGGILGRIVILGRGEIQVGLGKQGLRCGLVRTPGFRLGIIGQEPDGFFEIGDHVVPHGVQAFGESGLGVFKLGDHIHVHGNTSEIAGEIEIRVCAHEVGFAHITVAQILVEIHAGNVLDYGVRPVYGDI